MVLDASGIRGQTVVIWDFEYVKYLLFYSHVLTLDTPLQLPGLPGRQSSNIQESLRPTHWSEAKHDSSAQSWNNW